MLKCEFCGAKVSEDERYCPSCGENLKSGGVTEDQGMKEYDKEDAESCETLPDEGCDTHHPRRRGKAIIIGAVSLLLVAAIVVSLVMTGVLGGSGARASMIVAEMSGDKLRNDQLGYYYWGEFYYMESYYAQNGMPISDLIDTSIPFSEQEFTGEEWDTWHDYFLDMGIENWANTLAIYNAAVSAGHTMDSERAETLEGLKERLDADAEANGFAGADAMLKADYGAFAEYEGYREFLEHQMLAYSYVNTIFDGYVVQHSASLEMIPSVNIRHILLKFETHGDAAKGLAEELYADWLAVGTEDYFSKLATERTEDQGSAYTGGLYEGVAPGDMVETFNDWCFAEGRKVGDSGIVETEFGYHIMYYSGNGADVPKNPDDMHAAEAAAEADYSAWIENLFAGMGERSIYVDNVDVSK